ncbi:putative adenylyltransferase/sulfurtransferase MoeZ [bacterium HR39]|nr:putative adenylyltransferase/sulfurtransferase MoeZ [bacterium HR39]
MLQEAHIRRFARQIVLPEIGGAGQAKLLRSSVLVVGAGGLGSPLLLHLAAAGIGRIGIVDDDVVDETNLHRQVIYGEADVGRPKVEAAAERLRSIRSDLAVETFRLRLDADSARHLVPRFDIVADGSDNPETRLAVHAACLGAGRVLVSAAVQGMDGQLTTFRAHEGPPHPCLRCLHPDDPAAGVLPTCAQGGVLGPAAAVVGALQAVEVVKELVGGFPSLSGTLVVYDARSCEFAKIRIRRRPDCPLCGCFAAAAE